MSKPMETTPRPDLAFHDREPGTGSSLHAEKGETDAPTVGSEIEFPGFHLFAVSTSSATATEAREPVTPQSVGQEANEYPVIARTKKTICLGKTFPLMTVGTDNPVLGPQVLSEIQGLKMMRENHIPVEDVDHWLDGDDIPASEPEKSVYARLFTSETNKSDKSGREAHIARLQEARSYNIELMSAPLLSAADAALLVEASYSFSLAALKAIEECKAGKLDGDCFAADKFFPAGSAEHKLLSKPERGSDPAYMIKTSRLIAIYNELTKSKPDLELTLVGKSAGQEHWLRINADHKNSSQLNFGIPMSTFAAPPGGSDPLETWWQEAMPRTASAFQELRKSKIDSWLQASGLTAVAGDQEVRAFFIHFTIYFYVVAKAVNQTVLADGIKSPDTEKVLSIAKAESTRSKDAWGVLIKTGVRDALRGIAAPASRSAIRTWWKAGNQESQLTALRKMCALALHAEDSSNVFSYAQTLVTSEAPHIFAVDSTRYAGEGDGTYGFGYTGKPPAQTPWQIHSPTHNPTPLFYIQDKTTGKNRAALVLEIRAGSAINTFNRADSHSSFTGPPRALDAVQKRVSDFLNLLYKYK